MKTVHTAFLHGFRSSWRQMLRLGLLALAMLNPPAVLLAQEMRKPAALSLLATFAIVCLCRQGLPQVLPFDHYSTKDGLPSNRITSIFQDSRGYLWIGGDSGLSVYDGISFKTYGVDDGLPAGLVWCFAESRKSPGTIYVGTNDGLCKLVDGKFSVTMLRPHHYPPERSLHNAVYATFEDDEGRVWCGTTYGIYHIRGDSVSFFSANHDSGEVVSIVQMPDGRIWLNAIENLYTYLPKTRAVERFRKQPLARQQTSRFV